MAALIERVSFAGGEIGIPLQARPDLARYQIAVEKMENYIVMVEGGANRRPGTQFVTFAPNMFQGGKFIPFRLTATDYYMLCINGGQLMFLRDGGVLESSPGVPYIISVPWLESELRTLRSVSRGNVIFVASATRQIQEITRNGIVDWTINPFVPKGGPFEAQNLNTGTTMTVNNTNEGAPVIVNTNFPIFIPGHVGNLIRMDESEFTSIQNWAGQETIAANSRRRYNGNVYETPNGGDTGVDPPIHTGNQQSVAFGTGIIWTYIHGPFGLVRITEWHHESEIVGTIEKAIPASVQATPTFRWFFGSWDASRGFPSNIAWSGNRMWFFRGDRFWASSILDPHDLQETGEDDGALSGRLLSPDPTGALVNVTFALAAGALVVGSSDVEWIFRSSAGVFETVTAKTIRPTPDSNEGSIDQIPALVDGGVMFVNRTGRRLLYGKIDKELNNSQRMDVEEVTVSSRHVTDAGVRALAWQRDPNRILWIALNNGGLVGLTWMPKQQILAPHRHPMPNAFVDDIACLPSQPLAQDDLYLIVRRNISNTILTYIEVLRPSFSTVAKINDASSAWQVDCGLSFHAQAPVTQIFGLPLPGATVAILADGAEQPRKVVSAQGSITLERPARNVLVGLPMRSEILDLPRNLQTQSGPTVGLDRAVREVNVHVQNCGGGKVGTVTNGSAIPLEGLLETGGKAMGTPIELFHGLKRMTVECEIGEQVRVIVLNDDPMPCQVLGISPYVEVEEY